QFGPFRWETLLLGLVNVLILYGYEQFIIKASGKGPYAIMMVFNLGGGIIVPALVTPLLDLSQFDGTDGIERRILFAIQMVTIVIICVAIYLVSAKKEENTADGDKKKNLRTFFILSLLLAIANGLYGVVYAVHETVMSSVFSNLDKDALATAINQQKQMLIIYSFAGAAIIAAVKLIVAEKKKAHLTFVQNKKSLLYIILAAVVSALAVNVLVALVGIVDTTLLYTFDNAGVMLLSALASALIFKDKLSTKNIIGCVIMTLALVLMGASGALADALAPIFGVAA
ncbi:MAG: hypothetical protein IKV43_06620, partial [Clostridia bacterium]|nr:hypothetical protein [Clostridia bacterium]